MATDGSGRIYETVAAAGEFKLMLPGGRYIVSYVGEQSAATLALLKAKVDVGKAGEPVSVHLSTEENVRGVRQTLFIEDGKSPKR